MLALLCDIELKGAVCPVMEEVGVDAGLAVWAVVPEEFSPPDIVVVEFAIEIFAAAGVIVAAVGVDPACEDAKGVEADIVREAVLSACMIGCVDSLPAFIREVVLLETTPAS
ncbi:MAG: hypothetical protein OIF57_02420 [Marinobacterium sp.]|nr:hypothetical protein [Marinobacterium sp.]